MNIAFWRQAKKGFTLIEVLIVLSLLGLLLSLFPTLLMTVAKGYQTDKITFQQVTMFFNHVAQDMRTASGIEVTERSILLRRKDLKDIEIKLLTSGQMRRTSNGEGHVLLLEGVELFSCILYKQNVNCTIEMKGGDSFHKSLLLPYGKQEE